jgi:hypothetical protein
MIWKLTNPKPLGVPGILVTGSSLQKDLHDHEELKEIGRRAVVRIRIRFTRIRIHPNISVRIRVQIQCTTIECESIRIRIQASL